MAKINKNFSSATEGLDNAKRFAEARDKALADGNQKAADRYSSRLKDTNKRLDTIDWKDDELVLNKPLLKDIRTFTEGRKGKPFEGTDEELVGRYLNTMGNFDWALTSVLPGQDSTAGLALEAEDWSDETSQAFLNMMNKYEKTDLGGWETTKNFGRVVVDPSTWVGIGTGVVTLGAGAGSAVAAKVAARTGLKKFLQGRLKKKVAGKVFTPNALAGKATLFGAEGAAYTAADDLARQEVEDPNAEYDWGRGATAAGIGFGVGGALPIAGRVASKGFRKATGTNVAEQYGERLNNLEAEQRAFQDSAFSPEHVVQKHTKPEGKLGPWIQPFTTLGEAKGVFKGGVLKYKDARFREVTEGGLGGLLPGNLGKGLGSAAGIAKGEAKRDLLQGTTRAISTLIRSPAVLAKAQKTNRRVNRASEAGKTWRDKNKNIAIPEKPVRGNFKSRQAYKEAVEDYNFRVDASQRAIHKLQASADKIAADIDNKFLTRPDSALQKIGRFGKTRKEFLTNEKKKLDLTPGTVQPVPIQKSPVDNREIPARPKGSSQDILNDLKAIEAKIKTGKATKSEKVRYKLGTDGSISVKEAGLTKIQAKAVKDKKATVVVNKKTGEVYVCPK